MTTYYVRTNGADGTSGHDGTTPALAWLTLGYAMTHVTAGDTIWVGAGTYRVSSTIAPSSMASMTYLYGDTDGSQTGDAGEVIVTPWTSDTAAPAAVDTFTFASKNYWTLGRLTVQGTGPKYPINVSGTSANLTLQDCVFYEPLYFASLTFGTVHNFIIERCIVKGMYGGMYFQLGSSASGSGDVNANIVIRNSIVHASAYCIMVAGDNIGNARKPGGVLIANCLAMGGTTATIYVTGNISSTYPVTLYNSLIMGVLTVSAAILGQLIEDYNYLFWGGANARTNVSAGANTIADFSKACRFSLGHEFMYGAGVRPFGELVRGSPLLSWGGSTATGVPTDDLKGVTRPASGAASVSKAIGPLERANSGTRETSTVHAGANALKISGPGYHDFALPVAAAATTVTVYVQWDATYAGTKPSMSIRNGGECGVSDATATATGSSGAWEQLSIGPFTPTSTGFVTIRLLSSDTNGGGAAFFDDFAVS